MRRYTYRSLYDSVVSLDRGKREALQSPGVGFYEDLSIRRASVLTKLGVERSRGLEAQKLLKGSVVYMYYGKRQGCCNESLKRMIEASYCFGPCTLLVWSSKHISSSMSCHKTAQILYVSRPETRSQMNARLVAHTIKTLRAEYNRWEHNRTKQNRTDENGSDLNRT
jgi:hypothetical protein